MSGDVIRGKERKEEERGDEKSVGKERKNNKR